MKHRPWVAQRQIASACPGPVLRRRSPCPPTWHPSPNGHSSTPTGRSRPRRTPRTRMPDRAGCSPAARPPNPNCETMALPFGAPPTRRAPRSSSGAHSYSPSRDELWASPSLRCLIPRGRRILPSANLPATAGACLCHWARNAIQPSLPGSCRSASSSLPVTCSAARAALR